MFRIVVIFENGEEDYRYAESVQDLREELDDFRWQDGIKSMHIYAPEDDE